MTCKLTTTGTIDTVTIDDLGGRHFDHPTVDYDLCACGVGDKHEFTHEELRNSMDLKAALAAGYITLTDDNGDTITATDCIMGINGDRLPIDWVPTAYIPDFSIEEANNIKHIAAHLKGINTKLAALQTQIAALQLQIPFLTLSPVIPLVDILEDKLPVTGTMEEVTSGETTDYTDAFGVVNQHVYIHINSITAGGDIVVHGTSVSETTQVPVPGDTETLTVDESTSQFYQTDKKWQEVTMVDVSGLTGPDYDVGIVGYADFNNYDFEVLGYRLDGFATGNNPSFAMRIRKVQDDGDKKMSIVNMEYMGIDSGAAGDQIIDYVRSDAHYRAYDPAVDDLLIPNRVATFKHFDFSEYFKNDENIMLSNSKAEGIIIDILGEPSDESISNFALATIQLRYRFL